MKEMMKGKGKEGIKEGGGEEEEE
jgi:hypothetical protein